ncbi:MAG: hypothetical protein ABIB04_00880 [Patescibacteria group bacterium]
MATWKKTNEACHVCGGFILERTDPVRSLGEALCRQSYVCQNEELEWHQTLRRKLELAGQPHPYTYLIELQKEIAELRQKHCDASKK